VRAIGRTTQTDTLDPIAHQSGILPSTDMVGAVRAAAEYVILQPAPMISKSRYQAFPLLVGQLELHRLVGLLLNDRGTVPSRGVYYQLTNAELNQVTPAQLAIDGKSQLRNCWRHV
jgi:hypothetical protein